MKDLAVLIPSYNDTPSLLKTLESIVEDDNAFTVVIVDDGSKEPVQIDSSDYPFSIHVITQPENGGIVKALNTGLSYIRSLDFNYVARLDAADLQRPQRLGIQYQYLLENPSVSMVGSNAVFLDEDTNEEVFTTNLPLTPSETRRWMVFRNCFIHPTVMLRTGVLDKAGVYDPHYRHIEDYVLFTRIVENSDAANIDTPLVDCYIRQGGISLKNQRSQLIAGLKFKVAHPKPLDPLWYAFLLKRTSYLIIPPRMRNPLKRWFGFVKSDEEKSQTVRRRPRESQS